MDKLTELTDKQQEISSSIYMFLKSRIDTFEVLDKYDESNLVNKYGKERYSCLINKSLGLLITLDGCRDELSLTKSLVIYHIKIGNDSKFNPGLITYTDGHTLPINLTKRQTRRFRRQLVKRLIILNRNIKHQSDINKKKIEIEELDNFLNFNKEINRDIKLNDLITGK